MADHASTDEASIVRGRQGRGSSVRASRHRVLPPSALRRIGLTIGLIAANLVLVFTIGIGGAAHPAGSGGGAPAPRSSRRALPQPHAQIPPAAVSAPPDHPRVSDQRALEQWAQRLTEDTGIPEGALVAYGRAEMWMRSRSPKCGISWNTLAAIGNIASGHGRDAEQHDGWQHALGPLRIREVVWQRLASRATGDGAEPEVWNIGDAALTAARYLCSQPGSMREAQGWWDAMLGYRHSVDYVRRVFRDAAHYARAAD